MGFLISRNNGSMDLANGVTIDFENVTPTDTEKEVYNKIVALLGPSKNITNIIKEYKGCSEQIRQAISKPSQETENNAWNALKPCVGQLKEVYDYSLVLGEMFPLVLTLLCKGEPTSNLEKYQATAKIFGDILSFVLEFDDLKMGNPNIQNDFSYYRRTLSKLKAGNPLLQQVVVKDELANKMSLFYAYPTPMLKVGIDIASALSKRDPALSDNKVTECIQMYANGCLNAILSQKIEKVELKTYCLRIMVGLIVLYDHLEPSGVFSKKSPINIKNAVKAIQTELGENGKSLINALQFTTKHLNDETTPKALKALFQ